MVDIVFYVPFYSYGHLETGLRFKVSSIPGPNSQRLVRITTKDQIKTIVNGLCFKLFYHVYSPCAAHAISLICAVIVSRCSSFLLRFSFKSEHSRKGKIDFMFSILTVAAISAVLLSQYSRLAWKKYYKNVEVIYYISATFSVIYGFWHR